MAEKFRVISYWAPDTECKKRLVECIGFGLQVTGIVGKAAGNVHVPALGMHHSGDEQEGQQDRLHVKQISLTE